jgi:hypothetical protein
MNASYNLKGDPTMSTYNILILGASYGSLLASKILLGGHSVKLVCLPAEKDLINAEGFCVRIPIRGRNEPIELDSRKLPGRCWQWERRMSTRGNMTSSDLRCRSPNTDRAECANF